MFEDKTLVAIGCSHVRGNFLDSAPETHFDRSWVRKLEKLAGFKDSINLAIGGASNKRSFRVIREYVLDNLHNTQGMTIFFGITSLGRTEIASTAHLNLPCDVVTNGDLNLKYVCSTISPAQVNREGLYPKVVEFIKLYYGLFYIDNYEVNQFNLDLISLHTFLKHFNIEHYFIFVNEKPVINDKNVMKDQLPIITFENLSALDYAKSHGFKVDRDIDPSSGCNHLDHDGNEFVAKYIHDAVTKLKG